MDFSNGTNLNSSFYNILQQFWKLLQVSDICEYHAGFFSNGNELNSSFNNILQQL